MSPSFNSRTSCLPNIPLLLDLYNKDYIKLNNHDIDFLKEMMHEIYLKLLNTEDLRYLSDDTIEFIYNNCYEYDKDPKKLFGIMMENSSTFSSLIGYFYENGIGCNQNEEKALKMYKLAVYNTNADKA